MRIFTTVAMAASVVWVSPAIASTHKATIAGKVSSGVYGYNPPRDSTGLFNGAAIGDAFSISFFYDASRIASNIEKYGLVNSMFFVIEKAEVEINFIKVDLEVNGFYDYLRFKQDQDYVSGKPVQNLSISFNSYPSSRESYYSYVNLYSSENQFFDDNGTILTSGSKSISISPPYRSFSSGGGFSGGLMASNGVSLYFEMTPETLSVSAIPEPATWALMFVGFAMVAGATRYGRRRVAVTYA